ncbi:MAG: response regulator [Chloroflexi bacterium]|nr:response regulator [Chloroflexota bacterium]
MRVLIVDDEPLARGELRYLLEQSAGIETIDEAQNAIDALALLQTRRYDVLFLDIRMPGLSGLDAMKVVNEARDHPVVVFVTAYEEHAVQAFDVAAADYLLKPVDAGRLKVTLERVAKRRPAGNPTDPGGAEAIAIQRAKLPVEQGGHTLLVRVADIRYVFVQGDYTYVKTRDEQYVTRFSLTELAQRLGPAGFLRVHRSYLVNPEHVVEIHPFFGGTAVLKVDDNSRSDVPVSRSASRAVREMFGL